MLELEQVLKDQCEQFTTGFYSHFQMKKREIMYFFNTEGSTKS